MASRKRAKNALGQGRQEEPVDNQLVRALNHPGRARALAILNERVASPKEIAAKLGMPVGNISYHVKVLLGLGCVELVDQVPRRGAVEHYYRGVTRSFLNDANWAALSPDAKTGVSIAGLKVITEAAMAALEADTFDSRDRRHLSCSPMVVDEEGWKEVADLMDEALERLSVINGKSANRLAEDDTNAGTIRATAALLSFESPVQPSEKES